MFYLHPWEIDPEQPRVKAGRFSRFRHYTNLRRCEGRLRELLGDFAFGPVQQVLAAETLPSLRYVSAFAEPDPVVVSDGF